LLDERGLALAGVTLLQQNGRSFQARSLPEIDYLISRAYNDGRADPSCVARIDQVADALTTGAIGKAKTLSSRLRLPALDWDGAVRIAYADSALRKAYNPDEPRDWHGRWTGEGNTATSGAIQPFPPPRGPTNQRLSRDADGEDSAQQLNNSRPPLTAGESPGYFMRETEQQASLNPGEVYCAQVKVQCIASCTSELPTPRSDQGMRFFRCVRSCLDRHGC
jgi:hypothetical protein